MNKVNNIALAAALAVSMPAAAQTLATSFPLSAKYSDTGAKPVAGRSGSAAIEARALLGSDGTTDVEVTTGHFEGGAAVGALAKVQVKLLADDGAILQTDNYRKSLTGTGYASFTYDNLHRGQSAQVQASVNGIDPSRTDVVTVSTGVKLRPDLVAGITVQSVATVNTMVKVGAVMTEKNRDVGARATCRLLVDGTEIAFIPGAWVDADSAVTCAFMTEFATVGTKRLTVRITDVSPADFDQSNNEATELIDVVPPQPYALLYASVYESEGHIHVWQQTTNYNYDGTVNSQYTSEGDSQGRSESFMVDGIFFGQAPLDTGLVTLRHATDSTVMPMVSFDVATLPGSYSSHGTICRFGYYPGIYVYICSSSEVSEVLVGRDVGDAVYTITDGVYAGWLNPATQGWVELGSTYSAELRLEANGIAHEGRVVVPVASAHSVRDDAAPTCSTYLYPEVRQVYCAKWNMDLFEATGEAEVDNY